MLNFVFALIGLFTAGAVNWLADELPKRKRPFPPTCPRCDYHYTWAGWRLGLAECPACGLPIRKRVWIVLLTTTALFALLPSLIPEPINLAVNTLYITILLLVIVIDLEHKLILDIVTYPTTLLALLLSWVVVDGENSLPLAVLGAICGGFIFLFIYWLAEKMYGLGAIGLGDVKLALAMGAMLGFHRIFFALILAIFLGGVISLLLLVTRLVSRNSYLPYGQYLAVAAVIMLIWGVDFVQWYIP